MNEHEPLHPGRLVRSTTADRGRILFYSSDTMSNRALTWAWDQRVGDPLAKVVLIKLADQANDDGVCWPSRRTMADDCEAGMSTITKKVATLVEQGLLKIEARPRPDGGQSSNLYLLQLSTPPALSEQGPSSKRAGKEPSFEPALSDESARERWNPIYDALVVACFPAGATLTRREQQQVVTAAKNIASGNGTAELVPRVVRAYQADTSLRKCALTPMALSNNWSKLAPVASVVACAECGIAGGRHAEGCERIAA